LRPPGGNSAPDFLERETAVGDAVGPIKPQEALSAKVRHQGPARASRQIEDAAIAGGN